MFFVVSDPHGCYEKLRRILRHWDKKDKIIILGDLIDRGTNSLDCLQLAMELVRDNDAIVLKGNHEELLLEWLEIEGKEKNLEGFYYLQSFNETIKSFFPETKNVLSKFTKPKIAELIKERYPDVLQFMSERPIYFETDNIIFAHAGCSGKKNWKETAEIDCTTIRNKFIFGDNQTGKTIVFGHTTTENIRGKKGENDIWISPCGSKIGIDGGCAFGGQLNAILMDDKGEVIDTYFV